MLTKSVLKLSAVQRSLLLDVWNIAHDALSRKRQCFKYDVKAKDYAEWQDLIASGYIECQEETYMLTADADSIYTDLVKEAIKDCSSKE